MIHVLIGASQKLTCARLTQAFQSRSMDLPLPCACVTWPAVAGTV